MQARCEKQNRDRLIVSREIGRLLGQNTRGAHLFEVNVLAKEEEATTGKKTITGKEFARIQWARITAKSDWHELSDGCYLLRSNVSEWSGEQLWKAYIQLTEAENAFRIHKSDLSLRPSPVPLYAQTPGSARLAELVFAALGATSCRQLRGFLNDPLYPSQRSSVRKMGGAN